MRDMRDMRDMRIILTKDATEKEGSYSIEAGIADGVRGFDHHGPAAGNPAPCADDRIQPIPDGFVIYVTHLDADTFVGVLRMLGLLWIIDQKLVDLILMGRIDESGSVILPDHGRDVPTRQYMVGISSLKREFRFPRWNGEDIDVTDIFEKIISYSTEEINRLGREKIVQGEKAYQRCKDESVFTEGGVILLCLKTEKPFDLNIPYEDGYEIVVAYNEGGHISLRVHPDVDFQVDGKTFADVPFAGHPRAAGSLRGEKFTEEQAKNVRMVLEYLLRTLRTTA